MFALHCVAKQLLSTHTHTHTHTHIIPGKSQNHMPPVHIDNKTSDTALVANPNDLLTNISIPKTAVILD